MLRISTKPRLTPTRPLPDNRSSGGTAVLSLSDSDRRAQFHPGARLDTFLFHQIQHLCSSASRSLVTKQIRQGHVALSRAAPTSDRPLDNLPELRSLVSVRVGEPLTAGLCRSRLSSGLLDAAGGSWIPDLPPDFSYKIFLKKFACQPVGSG